MPAGAVWAALAPHVNYLDAANGFLGSFQPAVGGDLAFVLVSLVAGVLLGAAARLVGARVLGGRLATRAVEVGLLAGVVVGSVGASLVASRFGASLRSAGLHRLVARFRAHGGSASALRVFSSEVGFVVHAREVLAVLPVVAVASFLLVAAVRASSGSPSPGRDPVPEPWEEPPAIPPPGAAGAVPPSAG